jgi:hypothetical protein
MDLTVVLSNKFWNVLVPTVFINFRAEKTYVKCERYVVRVIPLTFLNISHLHDVVNLSIETISVLLETKSFEKRSDCPLYNVIKFFLKLSRHKKYGCQRLAFHN